MKRATIVGQAASGVPLWRCNEATSKWTGIRKAQPQLSEDIANSFTSVRVFPGNVGERHAPRPGGKLGPTRLDRPSRHAISKVSPIRPLVFNPSPHAQLTHSQAINTSQTGQLRAEISRIILGCMTFGNPSWQGSPWVLGESEALPILKRAYDLGINTWDTADTYSNGASETLIPKALKKYAIPRSKVVIMTKPFYPVMSGDEINSRPSPAVNDPASSSTKWV